MTEVSVQTFLDRLADAPLAASEIRVPIGEMKAVAAVLADRGEDPLSEERFWQEAFLRVTDDECATQEHTARLASEAVTEYLHRYGENPEPAPAVFVTPDTDPLAGPPHIVPRRVAQPEPGHPLEGDLEVKPAPVSGSMVDSYERPGFTINGEAEEERESLEPQEERRELEWEASGTPPRALLANSRLLTEEGREMWIIQTCGCAFRVTSTRKQFVWHEASTLPEAKAWCEDREAELLAKLLAKQEEPEDA